MDTPLRLRGLKRQMDFIGEIKDDRLKGILVFPHDLVIRAIRRTLGEEFIKNDDRTKENSDIATMFLVVAMHFK